MTSAAELLSAVEADPADDLVWLALADRLEEDGQAAEAELVRLREWLRGADLDDPQRRRVERRLQTLLLRGVRPALPRVALALPHGRELTVALVPPGAFWMGSPEDEPDRYDDEGPRHRVRISRGLWVGVTPVTQGQWRSVTGERANNYSGEERPVDQASWRESQRFCEMLGGWLGRPCRLPSEAEWEYACRAATTTRFFTGSDERALAAAAWYEANSNGESQPVGRKTPNAWGLHDLLGGVWEWCADSQREFPADAAEVEDPLGDESGLRVVRGGSVRNDPRATRCAHRGIDSLDSHLGPLGCRVVLPLG
jgi:uncharacterized protein (TIGR02996 family)